MVPIGWNLMTREQRRGLAKIIASYDPIVVASYGLLDVPRSLTYGPIQRIYDTQTDVET